MWLLTHFRNLTLEYRRRLLSITSNSSIRTAWQLRARRGARTTIRSSRFSHWDWAHRPACPRLALGNCFLRILCTTGREHCMLCECSPPNRDLDKSAIHAIWVSARFPTLPKSVTYNQVSVACVGGRAWYIHINIHSYVWYMCVCVPCIIIYL